jgi:hypothetical protein
MKVEQISVFVENKSGRLAEVARTLGEAKVNIRALSIADSSDFGILRIIVNDNDTAGEVLKQKGFTISKTEVLAVEVSDQPGGLAQILNLLEQEKLNVEYMYAFLARRSDSAVIVFRFEENDSAIQVLSSAGVTILEGSTIYNL